MDKILQETGLIQSVYSEEIILNEPFIEFASRFASDNGTISLLSGGDLDCSGYHILAARPWLIFSGRGNKMEIRTEKSRSIINSDPFDTLGFLINTYNLKKNKLPLPVSAGLFGYLSYDLKDSLERIPRTTIDDLELPDIYFTAPSIIVVHEKKTSRTTLFIPERVSASKNLSSLERDINWFKLKLSQKNDKKKNFKGGTGGFKSNFEKSSYLSAIDKIKDYINSGDIYQVNLSQRFTTDFSGDVFSLFSSLYQKNPAPFFAFLNCGNHQIVSTSPERFIKQTGSIVETRPIKGTRPRGKTDVEDNKLKSELQQSLKDQAELSMIVDLMRNDIGKVCESDSVCVEEHKRVEAYENVFHLISIVKGRLKNNADSIDLLKACFPGGSITGCPKIRSMEIIDELESNNRHIYTGSIGYISFHTTMDFSIAIRTATIINNKVIFSVGGGIVYDSMPLDEFDETIHKGQTLLNAFSGHEPKKTGVKEIAWINGLLKPVNAISIPIDDPGFHYAYGFFETIRVDNGKIRFLDEHITRLKSAWKKFYPNAFPKLSFKQIIKGLIDANRLNNETAAIKIITTKGNREKAPFKNSIIITAKKYRHRLKSLNKEGIDLVLYPKPRHTHLADYKSLNYLYYFLAGQFANKHGADEALILNSDGSISETNTGNIILIKNKHITLPASDHVLPGIMENKITELLKKRNFSVEKKKVMWDELTGFNQIILSNSLMGAVPVKSLNGRNLVFSLFFCNQINADLFQ